MKQHAKLALILNSIVLTTSTILACGSSLGINTNFAYNPSLDGLIQKIEPQRTAQTQALKALYDTGVYVSDIDENLSDSIRDQFATDTKNQLLIPDSLINSVGTSYKGEKTIFDMGSSFKVPKASSMNPTILNSAAATDLKKYLNLRNTYTEANSKYSMSDKTEADAQAVVSAMKDLDNLGYYYLEVWSKMPIDYYSTKASYEELQKDKTFVNIGSEGGYYGYYVKYAATKKPLNIDDLSKYVNITKSVSTNTTNSDINELTTVNSVKSQLDTLNTQLSDVTSRLDSLLQSSTTIQSDITTLNTQINTKINNLMTNDSSLKTECDALETNYKQQITDIETRINNKKQEFNKNPGHKDNGFMQTINKELNYKEDLQQISNLYNEKITKLNDLFNKSTLATATYQEITTLTNTLKNKVTSLENDIKSLQTSYDNLATQYTELQNTLNQITQLTYTTTTTNTNNITIQFNLDALATDSANTDLKNSYSMLNENKLSNYFYVTKAQLATKLNELVKTQTGVDPQLTATNILYNQNGITEGNNTYSYTFNQSGSTLTSLNQNIEIKDITKTDHVVNTNSTLQTMSNTTNSLDPAQVLNDIATCKETIKTNQLTLTNSLQELSKAQQTITTESNKITSYDTIASLYPNYQTTQDELATVNNEITNYTPTIINYQRVNPTYLAIIISVVALAIVLPIIITIVIKTKKKKQSARH